MKYIVIDASLSGTGIRDKYEGGYILAEKLSLSSEITQRLCVWLVKYENEHYNGFTNFRTIDELDQEGKDIGLMIKKELLDVKIEYFSAARMTNEIITDESKYK